MSVDPLSALLGICAGEVSDEACAALCIATSGWLAGDVDTLDAAFGAGGFRAALRKAQRDYALREAAAAFAGLPWREQARRLNEALRRYATSRWRFEAAAETCPHGAGTENAPLWHARRAGNGKVLSPRQLERVLSAPSSPPRNGTRRSSRSAA